MIASLALLVSLATGPAIAEPPCLDEDRCAWDDPPGACRPARRLGREADHPDVLLGFRCAAPPEEP